MATEGYVKLEYYSKGVPPYYGSGEFRELLDDESIVIKTPCLEMNIHQYYGMFKKFLMAVGFSEKNILQGACNVAFNDANDEKIMKEVAEEYDLIMCENLRERLDDCMKEEIEFHETMLKEAEDRAQQWERRFWELRGNLPPLQQDQDVIKDMETAKEFLVEQYDKTIRKPCNQFISRAQTNVFG